jgi:type IV secretory pathway VirB10-like protein
VRRLEEIEERRKLQEAERQKEKVISLFLILVLAISLTSCFVYCLQEAELAKERARKAAEAEAARLEQEKAAAAAMETRRVEEEARRRAAALEEEEAARKKQLEEARLAAEKAHAETEVSLFSPINPDYLPLQLPNSHHVPRCDYLLTGSQTARRRGERGDGAFLLYYFHTGN